MTPRMRTGLMAGASLLWLLTIVPMAGAGTESSSSRIWLSSKPKIERGPVGGDHKPERMPGRPSDPSDDTPVAPVPEPGTMALAAMGLASVAAAMRKWRSRGKPEDTAGL